MTNLNKDSSTTSRQPYGEIRTLPEARIGLYEILSIVGARNDDESQTAARLMREIIRVAQATPDGLQQLLERELAAAA